MKRTNEVKLTQGQQALVEDHLSAVAWVIRDHITVNEHILGMGWDDLFGEGCVWLCRAAQSYDPAQAQFSTYAKKVVRNGLISYCRSLNVRDRHMARLSVDENGDLLDRLAFSDAPDDFEAQIAEREVLELLRSRADAYSGVARLGIEALELKVKGMSVTEIARLYNVPPSHVGAWISRSAQKLRRDEKFLAAVR